jgi:hypothetical protein
MQSYNKGERRDCVGHDRNPRGADTVGMYDSGCLTLAVGNDVPEAESR